MCRRRRNGNTLGCLVVLAGVLIILALSAARGLLVVCAGDSAHLRRDLAAEVPIGGRGMRIIVIKLPACISRFLLRLRGGYEPE